MSFLKQTLAAAALVVTVADANALSPAPGTDTNSPEFKQAQEEWNNWIQENHKNSTIIVETPSIDTTNDIPQLPEIVREPDTINIADPVCMTDGTCVRTQNADGTTSYSNPPVTPTVTFNSSSTSADNNGTQPKGTLCNAQPSFFVCELLLK